MFEHLIFDFDGTISDSYPLFMQFIRDYAKRMQLPYPHGDDWHVEVSMRTVLRDCFELLKWGDHIPYQRFLDDVHQFQSDNVSAFQPFPEALELLQYGLEQKKQLYIYTHTGQSVHDMLKSMGIYKDFRFILDGSYGFPQKPAPDALLYLTKCFSLDPSTCMMIGDRPIDAYAAMNAGICGCLWDPQNLYPDAKPTYKVTSLLQIKDLIE